MFRKKVNTFSKVSNSLCFQWGWKISPTSAGAQSISYNITFSTVYRVFTTFYSPTRINLSGNTNSKEYVNAIAKSIYEMTKYGFSITYTYGTDTSQHGTYWFAIGTLS